MKIPKSANFLEAVIIFLNLTLRYIPRAGDRVLGTVTNRLGDYFRVDIGSADLALLNFLSFDGATKRNRPNVNIGDLIYGQIILTSKHIEPEVIIEIHINVSLYRFLVWILNDVLGAWE